MKFCEGCTYKECSGTDGYIDGWREVAPKYVCMKRKLQEAKENEV